jgi:hypothetical protein
LPLKDLLPFITALLGGMLAVVGGFLSNYLLKAKDKESERREFYRNQLENIYLLSSQLMDRLDSEYDQMWIVRIKKSKETSEPNDQSDEKILTYEKLEEMYFKEMYKDQSENLLTRLLLLINLYHPDLKEHATKTEQGLHDFYAGKRNFLGYVLKERPDQPLDEFFGQYINKPSDLLNEIHRGLLVAVEQKVKQYI